MLGEWQELPLVRPSFDSVVKIFVLTPSIFISFVSFFNNHWKISTLLGWVPWLPFAFPIFFLVNYLNVLLASVIPMKESKFEKASQVIVRFCRSDVTWGAHGEGVPSTTALTVTWVIGIFCGWISGYHKVSPTWLVYEAYQLLPLGWST